MGHREAELGWQVGSVFSSGFLEKNRDLLSTDILTLVHSSQNKFLREIFKLESADIKLGHGTILRGKAGSQLFKVGPHVAPFSFSPSSGPPGFDMQVQGKSVAWGLGFSVRVQKRVKTGVKCCCCHRAGARGQV